MKYKILYIFLLISFSIFAQNKNQSVGFKENKGQIIDQKGKPNPDVKYLLNTNGLNVQIKKNGFSYDVYETKKNPIRCNNREKKLSENFPEIDKRKEADYSLEYIYHRIDIDFVNSNPKVALITEQKSKDYDNYYNVPNKPEGVLMVHEYQQITYKNIYPNIDVVFSIPEDSLKTVEYNFVVHPKGKISDIQLKFNGAKTELVNNKIRIEVRFGDMEETLPMSWTEDGTTKNEIAVGYTKIKNNVYGFKTTENVSEKTIVIDPVPTRLWGTFYGEKYVDFTDIDSDKDGNIYFTGNITGSLSIFYATTGTHQTSAINTNFYGTDGVLTKFNANGNRIWSTYYGGIENDKINGLAIDNQSNIVITGESKSYTNISTVNSYMPIKAPKGNSTGDNNDAFIAKFNSNGVRIWGTYFGGVANDYGNDVDIDNNDNIYIVGKTNSVAGISINNNFQINLNREIISYPDGSDGFLSKFSSNGNIIWSTYAGGEKYDYLKTINVANNYLVVGGITESQNHISTTGVFQEYKYNITSINSKDCSVYKFSLNGNRLWSTYYGGEKGAEIQSIETDDEDNIYIGGNTYSTYNIATPESFNNINSYNSGFLAKLNQNGSRIWGTYIADDIMSITFKNNSIYVGGRGAGYESITTPCAYRKKGFGFGEGYLGKFSKNCELIFGTYVGGRNRVYEYTKACFDNNNDIIIAGNADSNNGIADLNSYQPNLINAPLGSETINFYLIKLKETNTLGIANPESNSPICIGNTLELKASGGTNYAWTGPNGFTSTNQNPTITNASALNAGKYSCDITGTGGCDGVVTVDVFVGDNQPPVPNLTTLPTINGDCTTLITTIPTATDACAGAIIATTASPLSYSLPGTYTIIWNYDDGNGNSVPQNQTVIITSQPIPTTTSPQTFCIQQNFRLSNITITGQNIKWYDALTNGTLLTNTTLLQNGKTYYASQTINGCESERTPISIALLNTPAPSGNSNQSFCTSQNPTLSSISVIGTDIKWYDNLGILLANTTSIVNGTSYFATQTLKNCESSNKLVVTVSLITSLAANNFDDTFCDDLNDGIKTINLSDYNSKIISNSINYNFTYYSSRNGAENQLTFDEINSFTNYKLPLGESKIYVRINSTTLCYAISELKLTLFSKPLIPINDIIPLCENNSILISAGNNHSKYIWSTGETLSSIVVNKEGNYWVEVEDNNNFIICKNRKDFTILFSKKATINKIETVDWTDTNNNITVYVSGNGDYEYSIDNISFQNSNVFTNIKSGQFFIYVNDKNGCGITTDEVYLLMHPKFFTPNGDGFNDVWKINFSEKEKGLIIKIFDRYGKFIKELNYNSIGWDGTYIGQELPAADYWFTVTRSNGVEYKGHFGLLR